jgi:hypothetical protein
MGEMSERHLLSSGDCISQKHEGIGLTAECWNMVELHCFGDEEEELLFFAPGAGCTHAPPHGLGTSGWSSRRRQEPDTELLQLHRGVFADRATTVGRGDYCS